MKTSFAGRAAIARREGNKLKAYRDTKGIWTIGVGHTAGAGDPRPKAGMTITAAQSDAILERDLADVERAVNAVVKVPVSQNQFDAMVSLAFNIGNAGFKKSTVVRCLNAGDVAGAGEAFMMWNKPKEIVGRRRTERAQFLSGKPASTRQPVTAATQQPPTPPIAPAPALVPVKVPGLDKPMVKSSTMWAALGGTGATALAGGKDVIDSMTGLDWRVTMAIVGLAAAFAAYWIISQRIKYRQAQRDMVAGVKAASAEQ